jgi:hypothetical protein
VKLHPDLLLGADCWAALSLQGGPDNQRAQELHLEALEAWLRASPSGQFDALDGNAWQGFAEMLLAARVYEKPRPFRRE